MSSPWSLDSFHDSGALSPCSNACRAAARTKCSDAFPGVTARDWDCPSCSTYEFLCRQHNAILYVRLFHPDGFPVWQAAPHRCLHYSR